MLVKGHCGKGGTNIYWNPLWLPPPLFLMALARYKLRTRCRTWLTSENLRRHWNGRTALISSCWWVDQHSPNLPSCSGFLKGDIPMVVCERNFVDSTWDKGRSLWRITVLGLSISWGRLENTSGLNFWSLIRVYRLPYHGTCIIFPA